MRYNKLINLLFILPLISACEDKYQTDNITRNVVVEGYVSPGDSVGLQVFRILTYSSNDTVIKTIDTCSINMFVNGTKYILEPTDSGYYFIKNSSITIDAGDTVSVKFVADGYSINASTQIPTKPTNFKASKTTVTMPDLSGGFNRGAFKPFAPLELTWDNDDESYYLVAVKPVDPNAELINPDDTVTNDDRPVRIFRNEPSASSSYNMEIFQFRYYGEQYIILYHLNTEYAALYNFKSNTSLNITEPSTNIENGLGIFTGMNTDTLIITVK
jgi:hypothetical protein